MLLIVLVFLVWVNPSTSILSHQEILALKDIYDHTAAASWFWGPDEAGPRWFNNSSVDSAADLSTVYNPCNEGGMAWQGVRCSGTPDQCDTQLCTVIYLQLPDFNINGEFTVDFPTTSSACFFFMFSTSHHIASQYQTIPISISLYLPPSFIFSH